MWLFWGKFGNLNISFMQNSQWKWNLSQRGVRLTPDPRPPPPPPPPFAPAPSESAHANVSPTTNNTFLFLNKFRVPVDRTVPSGNDVYITSYQSRCKVRLYNVTPTSMQRHDDVIDVDVTLYKRHVPARFQSHRYKIVPLLKIIVLIAGIGTHGSTGFCVWRTWSNFGKHCCSKAYKVCCCFFCFFSWFFFFFFFSWFCFVLFTEEMNLQSFLMI